MFSLIAAFLLALPADAPSVSESETAWLRFQPPEQPFIRVFRLDVEQKIDGETVSSSQVSSVRDLRFFARDTGWRLVSLPHLTEISGNLGTFEREIQELLMDQILVWQFNPEGELISTAGFENLEERIEDAFPESVRESVHLILNRDTQLWRLRDRWQRAYGWMLGRELRTGDSQSLEYTLEPPNGPPMHFEQTAYIREINNGRVTIDFESRAVTLEANPAHMEIEEKGIRVIDATSGLTLSEQLQRVIRTHRDINGTKRILELRIEDSKTEYRFSDTESSPQ